MDLAASLSKKINITIDNKTITDDIQLLLTFEDLGQTSFEKVAWKVSNVNYDPDIIRTIPVDFKSTLGFALASKEEGKYITPGQIITMDLQYTVDIVKEESGNTDDDVTFKNKKKDIRLKDNQISTWNNAEQLVGVSVGFMNGDSLDSAGYIPALKNKNQWLVTYTPNMRLYIASDAKTGQIISTIAKSDLVYTWELANNTKVPNGSHWLLYLDDQSTYQIKKKA